jgi:hypothetical protein
MLDNLDEKGWVLDFSEMASPGRSRITLGPEVPLALARALELTRQAGVQCWVHLPRCTLLLSITQCYEMYAGQRG